MQAMAARGVTVAELSRALASENRNVRGGLLDEGERQFSVRTVGRYETMEDVAGTVIRHGPSGTVTVGDIATVLDSRERATNYVNSNGKRTVVMAVNRQSGANTVSTIEAVTERLNQFTEQFKSQKVDIAFNVAYSELGYIEDSLHLVQHDLLLGSFLAALVLALFLRAGRPILIVVVSIPISLMSVFLALQLLDRSVNIIVLAGLSFASGMVVDDAIVALENIDRHMKELGKPPLQAAREGIEEVWGAIVSATLTKIAVFLPLLLNTTEAGLLFKDIAIAIMVSIFMSLVVTITVVPALSALLLRDTSRSADFVRARPWLHGTLHFISFQWLGAWVENAYTRFLQWAVLHRGGGAVAGRLVLLGAIAGIFLLSLTLLPSASYLPNGTRNFIFCIAQPVVGQRNEVTSSLYKPIEDFAASDPRVSQYFSVAAAPFFNGLGLTIKPEFADEKTLTEMQNTVSQMAFGLAGFQFFFAIRPSIFQVADKEFTLEITGPELGQLKQIADQLQGQLMARPDIVAPGFSVRSGYVEGVPELAVKVDRYRAAEMGLTVSDVAEVVEAMVAGRKVSTFTDGGQEYDLLVQGDPATVNNRGALASVVVDSRTGSGGVSPVRLGEVADVSETVGPSAVRHYNRQRSVQLTVNTRPDLPTQKALELAQNEIVGPLNAQLPEGYSVFFGQAADKLRETFTSLIFQGILAIVIIYLLMVPLFRSFYYPFIILLTVPLAWTGSFVAIALAYRFTGGVIQFDVLAMLGLIIMSGIVVSNAILIIHQMLNFQHEGMEPNQALYESARTRLRPIMMTVLTAVLGMAPLAFGGGPGSELYRSLGIIVEGGLISSTIFTLLAVPTLMSLINDASARWGRKPATTGHP
jgi:hydrophobic/amphiphilic exporter-1 (mainly G- bacteria), HAE1 family